MQATPLMMISAVSSYFKFDFMKDDCFNLIEDILFSVVSLYAAQGFNSASLPSLLLMYFPCSAKPLVGHAKTLQIISDLLWSLWSVV